MLNANVYIIVRKTNGDMFVLALGHLSASELAARVLTRAFHQRWYYDEFGKLPLPPKRQISSLIERLK